MVLFSIGLVMEHLPTQSPLERVVVHQTSGQEYNEKTAFTPSPSSPAHVTVADDVE